MHNLVRRLKKRGWAEKDIKKAVEIAQSARISRLNQSSFLEKRIYWILLLVIIAVNFAVSIALIPLLMTLKGAFLYFVLIILGLFFGFILEIVIRSIEHLEKKHHLALAFAIPLTALINIFLISGISNNLSEALNLKNTQNPIIIAIIYSISLALPYIIYKFVLDVGYYIKE